MDVLTDLLNGMRSRNQMYGLLELSSPWGLNVTRLDRLSFYAVARGSAVLDTDDKHLELAAGDLVLVGKGIDHTLRDHPSSIALPVAEIFARLGATCGGVVPFGGGGRSTTILAGGFQFETTALEPLIANLPALLHVRSDDNAAARLIESTVQYMAAEMQAKPPGYELVSSRLADVLFVNALRIHVCDNLCESAAWLKALGDPKLGPAIQQMHELPAEPWTVQSLAKTTAMSRSAFAARFTDVLGISPLAYLTRWRMHRAAEMLVVETVNICEIASRVGYTTESAFSKVFRIHFGESPANYRRNRRSPEKASEISKSQTVKTDTGFQREPRYLLQ